MVKRFPYVAWCNTRISALLLRLLEKKLVVFLTITKEVFSFKVKSAFLTLLVKLAASSSDQKVIGIHFLGYGFAKNIRDFWLVETLLREFRCEKDE